MARRLFRLAFLGSAAALAVVPQFFSEPPESLVMPRGPLAQAAPAGGTETTATQATVLAATAAAVPAADLFAAQSWYVAPPPLVALAPTAPPPPARPMAPPLPFKFIGKLDDSQTLRVFLMRGEQVLVVSEGDLIDTTYQVKQLDAERMTLVYLPLGITQSLSVGGAL